MARRRPVLGTGLVLATLWTISASGASDSPTQAVRTTTDKVLSILSDGAMKQPSRASERRRLLEDTIGTRFNYEEMSKRALTSHWKRLSEPEQKEFVQLFQSLLSNRYASKIEEYSDEKIQYLGERTDGRYAEVRTKVSSSKVEVPIDYRLLETAGEWFVYDVVIDGISLVRNYRGQFDSIIRDSSYAELVRRLRERTSQPGSDGRLD